MQNPNEKIPTINISLSDSDFLWKNYFYIDLNNYKFLNYKTLKLKKCFLYFKYLIKLLIIL